MKNAPGVDAMQSSAPIPSTLIPVSHIVKDDLPAKSLEEAPLVIEDQEADIVKAESPGRSPRATTIEPGPLGALAPTDYLLVDRRLRVKTVLTCRGKKNKYYVRTQDGNLLYTVAERSPWWSGYILCGIRPMTLTIRDPEAQEVLRLQRPFSLTTRLVPCQLQKMQIFSPRDTCIGSIEQLWSAVRPIYVIKNREEEVIFGLSGPRITVHFCRDVTFKIVRIADGSVVATTCKRWQGLNHAIFMSAIKGRFSVNYESELSLEEKAFVLAATILMDYMYYDI